AVALALKRSPSDMSDLDVVNEYRRIDPENRPLHLGRGPYGPTLVEPELPGPVFVIDRPIEVSPLTKRHRSDRRLVERFEPFVAGIEIGNAYSELNDPIEQRRRLEHQNLAREEPYGWTRIFSRPSSMGCRRPVAPAWHRSDRDDPDGCTSSYRCAAVPHGLSGGIRKNNTDGRDDESATVP
ncbi:MAG: amino acid--tRNA ligase-related protein, partial [Desulfobacterales bacterium]|nr:amino acid--tRNA ligase-related protein [Desulfobacterales bacterium]